MATSANAFLTAAANGTVTYGPELTQEFPSSTTIATAKAATDPSIITVSSSDQLVDPGAGKLHDPVLTLQRTTAGASRQ